LDLGVDMCRLQMMPGCGGAGDSSESHDTDPPGDDLDSPPSIRRRTPQGKGTRPHSDLLNQILIDKFKVSTFFFLIWGCKKRIVKKFEIMHLGIILF
jgi:hypothetical protein